MAMSIASLKGRMESELDARGFNRTNSGWMDDFLEAIATAFYNEVTINARATGNDSGGDSHNLTIV